jgi:hypothetical protein
MRPPFARDSDAHYNLKVCHHACDCLFVCLFGFFFVCVERRSARSERFHVSPQRRVGAESDASSERSSSCLQNKKNKKERNKKNNGKQTEQRDQSASPALRRMTT